MSNLATGSTGGACSNLKTDIPQSPLWHMGKAAKFESRNSFDAMQKAIDYLTCKAKNTLPFDSDEKEFLKELYEAFWWGGKYKGWKEAAQLARHYVHGGGKTLSIDPDVYKSSAIIIDTMTLMKKYIAELINNKKPYQWITSGDAGFYTKQYFSGLHLSKRNINTQGYARSDGLLYAQQNNQRLKNSNNRFHLQCVNSMMGNEKVYTRWFVEDSYDFEPFEKAPHHVTDIALVPDQLILKLPDGLSYYMTKLGIAKEYTYRAEWSETWTLK